MSVERVARVGLVAKGVSFAIVGVLALKLALGDGGKATSRQGALHQLAGSTFGKVFLALLAAGFAAYAVWRAVEAVTGDGWAKRAASLGRAAIYAGLTVSTVQIVLGSGGGGSQNAKAHSWTARLLGWPAGREIVGAAGIAIAGVGVWNLYRGLKRKFEEKWRGRHTWGARVGVVGHVARFVVFALIGIFVVKAAVEFDPREAIGLDGALQKLAHASYGPYLLGIVAFGLLCYAAYCLVDARYRDVSESIPGRWKAFRSSPTSASGSPRPMRRA